MDTRTTNVLSICSGLGGIELGIEAALAGRTATVCYVENEIGVASILAARMEDGSLDPAPIWTDMRTFDPEPWRGKVDIIAGGFPCQPHSVAGNKLGEDDPRELSGEVLRIAAGLGYPTLFLENVPGILRFYWDSIRPKLREMGYSVAEGLFTASETGAPHKRERLFIMANAGESRIWDQARTPRGGTRVEDVRQGDGQERTVRSFSTGMDDSEHNGLAGPEEPRGVGLRARHGAAGEVKPEQPTRSGSGTGGDNELAHAEEYGVQEPRPTHQPKGRHASATPVSDGEELAHAECERGQGRELYARDEPKTLGRGEASSSRSSGKTELAHADHEGSQGRDERRDSARECTAGTSSPELGELPLYPPGPGDHEGWAWLLDRWPELAPTVCKESPLQYEMSQIECQFCGSPDGPTQELPTEVLLRGIGNGVVPLVAALAFRELSKALK